MTKHKPIKNVPTHFLTGFLGSGKTSAILHLLKTKPEGERWAVLVNEFGEIGIDGSLVEGQMDRGEGIFVREVPGGCMCCAAGVPMRVALTMLLSRSCPDRLLIEPTGLGHPKEVLNILAAESFREVLALQKVVTLVDARKLTDPRYTAHETFVQQIEVADVLIGNKSDLYNPSDRKALERFAREKGAPNVRIHFTEFGALQPAWLDGPSRAFLPSAPLPIRRQAKEDDVAKPPLPASGRLRSENKGQGFQSVGWRFSPHVVFSRRRLLLFLQGMSAERIKGVFITESGVFGYNATQDGLTESPLDDCAESRVEWIATEIKPAWEQQLLACVEQEKLP